MLPPLAPWPPAVFAPPPPRELVPAPPAEASPPLVELFPPPAKFPAFPEENEPHPTAAEPSKSTHETNWKERYKTI